MWNVIIDSDYYYGETSEAFRVVNWENKLKEKCLHLARSVYF